MQSLGLRISDGDFALSVRLCDILSEISYGKSLFWAILWADLILREDDDVISTLQDQVKASTNGALITWEELNLINKKKIDEYELLVIGCKNLEQVHRYENDYDMYMSCDIVIELIDCAFWEVFAKDHTIIDKLAKKFNKVEFLTLDSLKKESDNTEID